jgi:2-oxoglutarate dehydrogenase E2 component (dihydrolipoamide succinyltransferase)
MKKIVVPKMGMSTTEVEIMSWKVKVGDYVEEGDPIVEIESEKTSIEIVTKVSGVISEISHMEGEVVKIGSTIGKITD